MPFFSFRFDLSILPLSAPPSLPASRRRAISPRLFRIALRFPPLLTAHYCLITAKSSSTLTTFPSKYANPNIVGYANIETAGKYNPVGFCLAGISQNGKVKLSDMLANGWNYENDFLQILNPSTCMNDKAVVWLTTDEAVGGGVGDKQGWYDAEEFTYEGDDEFDLGSGFLSSCGSKGIKFVSVGEVFEQAFTMLSTGKYMMIPNALPRKIKLSEITVTGWNYENDFLQKLNPSTCLNDKSVVWLTEDEAVGGGVGDKAGWYDAEEFTYEGDNVELQPGEGLLASLGSTGIKFNFPKSIPEM